MCACACAYVLIVITVMLVESLPMAPSRYIIQPLPGWMDGREHEHRHDHVQTLRRDGEGHALLTEVMDEGVTHGLVIVGMLLKEEGDGA